jgi:hypothetical protein
MRASQRCREKDAPIENALALPMCVHNPLRIKYFHEALAGNIQECLLKPKIGIASYKWAWADGEPYVHRYNLNKIRTECKDKNVQFLRGLGGFV